MKSHIPNAPLCAGIDAVQEKLAPLLEEFPPSLAKGTGEQGITESISGSVGKQEQGKLCAEWLRLFISARGTDKSWVYSALTKPSSFP